jgi:hypothetical protein
VWLLVLGLACSGVVEDSEITGIGPAPEVVAPVPEPVPVASSACPEGVNAVPYWQGEYPGPVVHVKSAVTVKAFADPCSTSATVDCLVPDGLYHPWTGSGGGFVTVRPEKKYVAREAFRFGSAEYGADVAKGGEVLVTGYLAPKRH